MFERHYVSGIVDRMGVDFLILKGFDSLSAT